MSTLSAATALLHLLEAAYGSKAATAPTAVTSALPTTSSGTVAPPPPATTPPTTTSSSSTSSSTSGTTTSTSSGTTSTTSTGSTTSGSSTAPHGAVVTVSSAAQLMSALASAHGGDTIQLAAGTYTQLNLSNLNFSSAVTITSVDSSHPALLAGLKVNTSSGLTFTNVEMTTVGADDAYYGFRISGSRNINFNQVNVHGDATQAPSTQLMGFYFSGSTGVSVTNSNLHDMNAAIVANNDIGLNISNNSFTNLSKGGVEMGGGSNIVINNNTFTNFYVGLGVHADAIQAYTSSATTTASNVSITNNVITRGAGNAVQGIFIADNAGNQPYHNLTIANNSVLGGMWNSIFVASDVTGTLNVSNNTATSWAGADPGAASSASSIPTTSFQAGLVLDGNFSGAQVTETGNTAQYYLSNGVQVAAPAGNTQVSAINAVTSLQDLHTAVVAAAASTSLMEHATVTGSLLTGATGGQLYLADAGAGSYAQRVVGANGLTLAGTYGNLTVHADGSYSYAETHNNLTVGQTYVDHFTTTVANQSGQATSSTLDVMVQGSGVGDGASDLIVGGAGTEVMSGFGGGTNLYSGTGQDTYQFDSVSQSAPTHQTQIIGYKAGDVIDLSHLDPNFHIVSRFDGHADEVVVTQIGTGNWIVYGDTAGSGSANFQLHVLTATTATTLTADSFHL